jgi:hypothetical protein
MEQADIPESHPRGSRLIKLGRGILNFGKEWLHVMKTADLNPHEGKLRYSAAPPEFLPKVPDYPPDHTKPQD